MMQHTAAEEPQQGAGEAAADGGHQYSVVLPESLTSNRWIVRRRVTSGRLLVGTCGVHQDRLQSRVWVMDVECAADVTAAV